MTNLGCVTGGVPRCRDTNNQVRNSSQSLIMPDPLFCNRRNSDKQRELRFWDLVEARFQDADQARCICRSNLFPVCESGVPPRCPDGSKPLKKLTILPPFLDLCEHEDDWNKKKTFLAWKFKDNIYSFFDGFPLLQNHFSGSNSNFRVANNSCERAAKRGEMVILL